MTPAEIFFVSKVHNRKEMERYKSLMNLHYMSGTLPLYTNDPKKLPKLEKFLAGLDPKKAAVDAGRKVRDRLHAAPVFRQEGNPEA